MDRIDPRIVAEVLDELYERLPYLPRPDDLVQTIVEAHNELIDGQPAGLAGVVSALWPIGAADGARRGYAATLAAVLALLTRVRVDRLPDARARWVVAALGEAARSLPAAADPQRTYPVPPVRASFTSRQGLARAVELGLGSGWQAGHHDGTEQLLNAFNLAVEDLVGAERLSTTFLNANLPAHALLEEIDYLAYRFAERDRENPVQRLDPAMIVARSVEAFLHATGGDQARGFRALRRVDPSEGTAGRRPRPTAGPRNRRPGR